MCNRFTLQADLSELTERFGISRVMFYYANQRSISPGQSVGAISIQGKERTLDEYRWGLMPFWAKDSNRADISTLFDNRAFDYLIKRQRCVIPGSSFDQVTPMKRKKENVQRFVLPSRPTFAMAGVYDIWQGSFGDELRTCTILAKKARNWMTGMEEYIPIILDQEQMESWLSPEMIDKAHLKNLIETMEEPAIRELPSALWDQGSGWDELEPEPAPVRPGMI